MQSSSCVGLEVRVLVQSVTEPTITQAHSRLDTKNKKLLPPVFKQILNSTHLFLDKLGIILNFSYLF